MKLIHNILSCVASTSSSYVCSGLQKRDLFLVYNIVHSLTHTLPLLNKSEEEKWEIPKSQCWELGIHKNYLLLHTYLTTAWLTLYFTQTGSDRSTQLLESSKRLYQYVHVFFLVCMNVSKRPHTHISPFTYIKTFFREAPPFTINMIIISRCCCSL